MDPQPIPNPHRGPTHMVAERYHDRGREPSGGEPRRAVAPFLGPPPQK